MQKLHIDLKNMGRAYGTFVIQVHLSRLSKKDIILPEPSGQNLHSLFKLGDQSVDGHSTGSGSGMAKLSLFAYLTSI